jgi:hypothetical protein
VIRFFNKPLTLKGTALSWLFCFFEENMLKPSWSGGVACGKIGSQTLPPDPATPPSKTVYTGSEVAHSKEDAEILGGTASMGGSVQKRIREIKRYGLVSYVDSNFSWATASLGYWFESSDMIVRNRFSATGRQSPGL